MFNNLERAKTIKYCVTRAISFCRTLMNGRQIARTQSDHTLFALACTTTLFAQKGNFVNNPFPSSHFRDYGQNKPLAIMSSERG